MSICFGKTIKFSVIASVLLLTFVSTTFVSVSRAQTTVGAIGGVRIDANGVLAQVTSDLDSAEVRALSKKMAARLANDSSHLRSPADLRMFSLKAAEAALQASIEDGTELPDEIKYMGGIQRIEYLFVEPTTGDVVLAGPGDGWKLSELGDVVGVTNGRPVCHFEDLVVALRSAEQANQGFGISVSIDPREQGIDQLKKLFRKKGFEPEMQQEVEEAMGPQDISLTGLPATSRMAHVLVVADYHMKRLAMGFEDTSVDGMPSILELAQRGGNRLNMSPRFWMECQYDSVRRTEDGLTWHLGGPGAKTLTESQILDKDGQVKETTVHPIAKQWANNMTERFGELANAESIFADLQNVMDASVFGALIQQQGLLSQANLELPGIMGTDRRVDVSEWNVPKTVSSQCSFVRVKRSWMVTVSGGIQVDSWGVLNSIVVDQTISEVRTRGLAGIGTRASWNAGK